MQQRVLLVAYGLVTGALVIASCRDGASVQIDPLARDALGVGGGNVAVVAAGNAVVAGAGGAAVAVGAVVAVGAGGAIVAVGAGGAAADAGDLDAALVGAGGGGDVDAGMPDGALAGSGGSGGGVLDAGADGTGGGGGSIPTGAGGGDAGPSKGDLGAACNVGDDCLSGSCVDALCCDDPCAGACVACSAAKKGAGLDGTCGPIMAGTDPDDECATQPQATCGTTGDCNGGGACRKHSNGAVCNLASCTGDTQLGVDLCDGNGSCIDGGMQGCGGLGCNGDLCKKPCVGDTDCPPTAYCDGQLCALKLGLGSPCTEATAARCATGHCADGVCCDAMCSGGPCLSCKKTGGSPMDGTCAPIDGTPCDDGNGATPCSFCQSGVCQGKAPPANACEAVIYSAPSKACQVYSKLDGLPCKVDGTAGICIAGSCLTASSPDGGSAVTGGATSTSSTTAGQGGSASGPSGAGGDGSYTLKGGGCSMAPGPSKDLRWALLGLLVAWRRASRSRGVRGPR